MSEDNKDSFYSMVKSIAKVTDEINLFRRDKFHKMPEAYLEIQRDKLKRSDLKAIYSFIDRPGAHTGMVIVETDFGKQEYDFRVQEDGEIKIRYMSLSTWQDNKLP